MEAHRVRQIRFFETLEVNDWKIKVYTISKTDSFDHLAFYPQVLHQLPGWLGMENSFDASHDRIGFLILHAGTEGIFSIVNWWVGNNMLNTHIFLTPYNSLSQFRHISGDGLAPCIWELEVINFERVAWIHHVLKKAPSPDYASYLNEVFNGEL